MKTENRNDMSVGRRFQADPQTPRAGEEGHLPVAADRHTYPAVGLQERPAPLCSGPETRMSPDLACDRPASLYTAGLAPQAGAHDG